MARVVHGSVQCQISTEWLRNSRGKSGESFVTVAAIVGAAAGFGIVLWKIGGRGAVTRSVFAVATVTCILVGNTMRSIRYAGGEASAQQRQLRWWVW